MMVIYPYPPNDTITPAPKASEFPERDANGAETGKKFSYLTVDARKRWFRRFCAEHEISGAIESGWDKGSPLPTFRAAVLMNGELVATGNASPREYSDPNIRPVEAAETAAIGRALANAGFCLEDEAPDKMDGDGVYGFADAPRPIQPVQLPFDGPTGPAAMDPDEAEARRPDPPATMQEAFALKVPFGQYKGRMLGEVNATDRNFLLWLAGIITSNRPFTSQRDYPRMMAAVNMVLNA